MEYIERIKAMNICRGYSEHCFETNDSRGQDIADRIEDDIVALPTADVVEVKRGKWIKLDDDFRSMDTNKKITIHQCSCCGGFFQHAPYNYCPNCGAKMNGGKEE